MKKHLPLTGLAATLCLLLSGCAPLERINKIDNTVSQDENGQISICMRLKREQLYVILPLNGSTLTR